MPENQWPVNFACHLVLGQTQGVDSETSETGRDLFDRRRLCGPNTVSRKQAKGSILVGQHEVPGRIPLLDLVCRLVR